MGLFAVAVFLWLQWQRARLAAASSPCCVALWLLGVLVICQ